MLPSRSRRGWSPSSGTALRHDGVTRQSRRRVQARTPVRGQVQAPGVVKEARGKTRRRMLWCTTAATSLVVCWLSRSQTTWWCVLPAYTSVAPALLSCALMLCAAWTVPEVQVTQTRRCQELGAPDSVGCGGQRRQGDGGSRRFNRWVHTDDAAHELPRDATTCSARALTATLTTVCCAVPPVPASVGMHRRRQAPATHSQHGRHPPVRRTAAQGEATQARQCRVIS